LTRRTGPIVAFGQQPLGEEILVGECSATVTMSVTKPPDRRPNGDAAGEANRSLSGQPLPVWALTLFRSLLLSNRPRLGTRHDTTRHDTTRPTGPVVRSRGLYFRVSKTF
jgi:hypothetical protein